MDQTTSPLPNLPAAFSRRRAIFGAVAVTVAPAMPIAGKVAAATALPRDVGVLWRKRQLAQGASTVASAAYRATVGRLPWWAQPGPRLVDCTGAMCGDEVSWPAIEGYTLPQHEGAFRRVRIGPEDIRQDHQINLANFGAAKADALRTAALADLEARRARQKAAEDAVGLPMLSTRSDEVDDTLYEANRAIENLPAETPSILAAQVLIEIDYEAQLTATIHSNGMMGLAAIVLRGLLPHLDGELAADAADFVADLDRPLKEMRLSRGLLPSGDVA